MTITTRTTRSLCGGSEFTNILDDEDGEEGPLLIVGEESESDEELDEINLDDDDDDGTILGAQPDLDRSFGLLSSEISHITVADGSLDSSSVLKTPKKELLQPNTEVDTSTNTGAF
jgi:hypothetical protein